MNMDASFLYFDARDHHTVGSSLAQCAATNVGYECNANSAPKL